MTQDEELLIVAEVERRLGEARATLQRYKAALERIAGLHQGAVTRTCATLAREALTPSEDGGRTDA